MDKRTEATSQEETNSETRLKAVDRREEVNKQMQQHSSMLAAVDWSQQLSSEVVTEKSKLSEPLKQYEAIALKWFRVSKHLIQLNLATSAGQPSA